MNNKEHEEYTECPECRSTKLVNDYERAELVCNECGLVIEENIINPGAEWRVFDSNQQMKRSRVGSPMTHRIHDKGLGTMIDLQNRDLNKLRKLQSRIWVNNATKKSLVFALSELDRMASALGLSKYIREFAAVIYRKAAKKGLRGRCVEGVVAAVLYISCRKNFVPRTLDEITAVSRVSRKEVGRMYKFVSGELGLKLMPTSPVDYVPRFASGLNLNGGTQSKAVEILRQAEEKGLTSGRDPTSVAAAAIYIASILCGERRTQKEVADVTGVTEVTIKDTYNKLANDLDIIVRIKKITEQLVN